MLNRFCLVLVLLACTIVPPLAAQQPTKSEPQKSAAQDSVWDRLAAGNKRFAENKRRNQDYTARREKLNQNQHPKAALLSCSDSRVPPEILFDQGLGDLFVVRTAGNSADPIGIGSLEYAVEHLGVGEIVVLGHQSCGAVKAACSGEKMPTPNLEAVVAPVAPSCSLAKEKKPRDETQFAIEDHVHRTAASLLTNSEVLKHAADEGKLRIVEAVYSFDTGIVTRLR